MAMLAAVQSSCAVASPAPLDRALQREFAALAAIEADHRSACRWLDGWSGPTEVKEHLARHLEALQPTIPHLTRSSLHRCLKRHGISRLPDTDGGKPRRSRSTRI